MASAAMSAANFFSLRGRVWQTNQSPAANGALTP
jgi:hypothetical protein